MKGGEGRDGVAVKVGVGAILKSWGEGNEREGEKEGKKGRREEEREEERERSATTAQEGWKNASNSTKLHEQ